MCYEAGAAVAVSKIPSNIDEKLIKFSDSMHLTM